MENILQNIVVVSLSISLWTGRKKLRPEDIRLGEGGSLPPEKLASLGSKKVMDPARLAPFAACKRQAERACLAVGSRFLGGYAVPAEKVDALMAELDGIGHNFESEKTTFLAAYNEALGEWCADNAEWSGVIRAAVESPEYIRNQLGFKVATFHLNPVPGHEASLTEEVEEGLAATLRREIRQAAKVVWEESFSGRTEVGQKAIRPVRAMVEKLDGLSFLSDEANGLAEMGMKVLKGLPISGAIVGPDFAALSGLVCQLADVGVKHAPAPMVAVEEEPEEQIALPAVEATPPVEPQPAAEDDDPWAIPPASTPAAPAKPKRTRKAKEAPVSAPEAPAMPAPAAEFEEAVVEEVVVIPDFDYEPQPEEDTEAAMPKANISGWGW